ncbi:MAG: class I SAM-dependent methyltransferase [Dehalococcoidales bacterium]|nr:class I SAM-dependent methyltransferase [Dehalococcoidales bacterium]
MVRPRIPETDEGIQGEFDVREYDRFARKLRDRGWMETDVILKSGINRGLALEIGPGPGYVGLEWLKKTDNSRLEGLEISRNMIAIAEKNAREYGFDAQRIRYIQGNALDIPFPANRFDAVFSSGSLHEWEKPLRIMSEIYRVLKPGGRYCICDLRRDLPIFIKWFLFASARPSSMRHGLSTSLQASYTRKELEDILAVSSLDDASVKVDLFGITVTGKKV